MRRYSLLLAVAAGITALAGAASAADLSVRKAPASVIAPQPAFSWNGIYVGVQGGFGAANFEGVFDSAGAAHLFSRNDVDGGFFGITAGLNVQRGILVYGFEGDFSWMNREAGAIDRDLDLQTAKLREFATLRSRLGVAYNNWLFYVTGGAAYASARATTENGSNTLDLDTWGVALGIGFEWAVWQGISLKSEYMHLAFNNSVDFPANFNDTDIGDHFKLKDIDIWRLGLNWRFSSWTPPLLW